MLRRTLFALLGTLLLAACGRGGEDFTVKIARPPSRVAAALGQISLDAQMSTLFPGLKVERTAPADGEIFYTVPGNAEFPAAIHFTLESIEDGKATVVHAAIDVPEVKVTFDKKSMVISETKVERAVHDIVKDIGGKLEEGGDTVHEREQLSQLLTVLAVVTDTRNLAHALDMQTHPEWYLAGLDWLGGSEGAGDYPVSPYGDPALPQDPGAAARQQEARQQNEARDASAPMNDPVGDSAAGDNPGAEE